MTKRLINQAGLLLGMALFALGVVKTQGATLTNEMRFNQFSPRNMTINQGDTIIWINRDSQLHDVVHEPSAGQSQLFKSSLFGRNGTFTFTFNTAGTYNYFCTPHKSINMLGTVTVLAVNSAPTVTLTSPAEGSSFRVGTPITITANAADQDGTVSQVEFFAGNTSLGVDTTAPYSVVITPSAGSLSITARATDNQNASTTSTAINITVNSPPPAPTLSQVQLSANNFGFTITGGANARHIVQSSSDLIAWTPVSTNQSASTTSTITVPRNNNAGGSYFRVVAE